MIIGALAAGTGYELKNGNLFDGMNYKLLEFFQFHICGRVVQLVRTVLIASNTEHTKSITTITQMYLNKRRIKNMLPKKLMTH